MYADGNTFPDCKRYGRCYHTNILAISPEEFERMHPEIHIPESIPLVDLHREFIDRTDTDTALLVAVIG